MTSTTGSTVTATGLTAGSYDYTVTCVDGNGCEATASITVVVNPLPTVSIDPVGPICEDASATLTANGGTGTYVWTGDGLNTTTGQTVVASNLTAGTYDYSVTVTDANGCTNTAETCLLYTSPSPRDKRQSRMPSSA